MSILKRVRSFISRKSDVEMPAAVIPMAPMADTATQDAPAPDNVIYIYSHGFTNGVYRIEPDEDSFERFLEYCSRVDQIKEKRVLKEAALTELEMKLNAATLAYTADIHTVIEKGNLAEHLSLSLAELNQNKTKAEQQEAALITQAKEVTVEFAWVPALFYLIAGIVFIVADVSITKQITSWGFGMSGIQSWIFAIGLAFTAFLIKPTVDRLLEKPFHAAGLKLKALYKIVLLGITMIGLVMLFLLGKFRSDSEIADKKLKALQVQMIRTDFDSPEFRKIQAQYDSIQEALDENSNGKFGLILSGMLFAIGGAICLSISFGALKQLISRYWILPFRTWRVKKKIVLLEGQATKLRLEHTAVKTDHEKAERSLAVNEMSLLRDELKKLQEERSVLLAEFYEAQQEKERSLYVDGKNKGGKYRIEGDLTYKTLEVDHASINLGKQGAQEEGQSGTSLRSYTRRPFVKMRKMIADNFNKNQNNPTYDGTEFEIVS